MSKQSQNIHGCTRILKQKLTKRISELVAVASGVHMAI